MDTTTTNALYPQPTARAIAEGMRAAQGKSHLYSIQRIHPESRIFWVEKKGKRGEIEGHYVETGHRKTEDKQLSAVHCTCERFQFVDALGERHAYCSHSAMVEEILHIEALELEFDEIEEGKTFMRHHNAEARK